MKTNKATVQQICDGLMGLHEAIERKGEAGRKHSILFKIALAPSPGTMTPEQVKEAVDANAKISDKLTYAIQAGMSTEVKTDLDVEQVKTAIRKFKQDLEALPSALPVSFHFEFVSPNEYEGSILKEMEAINEAKQKLAVEAPKLVNPE